MSISFPNLWVLRQSGPVRRSRLFCFPYAGGNAATFLQWQAAIDSSIEICGIQLPGRGKQFRTPHPDSFQELVETVAQVVLEQSSLPFSFFGHSMGGLMAFEVARYLQRHNHTGPVKLLVSGSAAPQHRGPPMPLHTLGDRQLVEVLKEFNGTPQQVLENHELMQLMLPVVRADFAMLQSYEYRPGVVLNTPIQVLAGRSDPHTSLEQTSGWAKETTSTCATQWFDGDHFFVHSNSDEVIRFINAELQDFAVPDLSR